jgi:hypothetical protein
MATAETAVPGMMGEGCDQRWLHLQQLLSRPSPFPNETGKLPNGYYEPSREVGRCVSPLIEYLTAW